MHEHNVIIQFFTGAVDGVDVVRLVVDGILDKQLVGKCYLEEVRQLAKIAHKCLHKSPRKRPSIGEVLQGMLRIKQSRLVKEDTMSFASNNFSRTVSLIEDQQVELSRITINHKEMG